MIIVNLKGGLGNQMFQYALGRNLALKNKTALKLDTTSLSRAEELGNIYRPFALDSFKIESTLATDIEVQSINYPHHAFSRIKKVIQRKIFRQKNVVFDSKILDLKGNQYLDGYWQSPNYFEKIREVLLKDFTLVKDLSLSGLAIQEKMLSTVAVGIHIRRGDYVENKRAQRENGVCSTSYYQKAVNYISALVSDTTFFVFSDDIVWVKENLFLPKNTVFVKDEKISTAEELILMSKCKHNIIANSSFSWWAAWLNQNPSKIVIAPTPWFDTITYDKDLILPTWIQIPK